MPAAGPSSNVTARSNGIPTSGQCGGGGASELMSGRRRGRGRKAQNRARSHESGRRPQTGTSRETATSEPKVEVEGKTKRWSIVRLVVGLAKRPVAWGVALLIAVGSLWLNGTLNTVWNERIPSPQQAGLYLTNVATKMTVPSESKFRVVLCWSRSLRRRKIGYYM